MALEEVLHRQSASSLRDPGAYFLSVFGEPSTSATWGFRIEGHHLSLNLTLVDGVRPVEAPAFLGASPSRVASGLLADTRVLGPRGRISGFTLLGSLDDAQRKAAVFQATAPDDILTGPGARLTTLPGLSAERMTAAAAPAARRAARRGHRQPARELAVPRAGAHRGAPPRRLVFSWAGGAAGRPAALLPRRRPELHLRVRQHAGRREPHPHRVARARPGGAAISASICCASTTPRRTARPTPRRPRSGAPSDSS